MSGIQVRNGKALEWRVACEFSRLTGYQIQGDAPAKNAEACYRQVEHEMDLHERFDRWVPLAVSHILEKERGRLSGAGLIAISADAKGAAGDVRDVSVCTATHTFGVSCKNNSKAYKHSRISRKIDFVKKWHLNESGCSHEYLGKASPVFEELEKICAEDKQSGRVSLWSERGQEFISATYLSLITAFRDELLRIKLISREAEGEMASAFAQYVVGKHDFYKLIVLPKQAEIEAYNFKASLSVSRMKLPTRLIDVSVRGNNTLVATFDRGYAFTLRIHSASSRVQSSLKFDIKADGTPSDLYRHVLR